MRHLFLIVASLATAASAADLQVDILNPACDDSVGEPYCTIPAALAMAVNDDVITVNPGLYEGSVQFDGKDIMLVSRDGPATTEINGLGQTTVEIGPGGHIEGFTISGGFDSFGAGMDVIGTGAVVRANVFDGNVQSSGGFGAGIGGNNASAIITGNVFQNHSCDDQFLSGVITFVNGSFPEITDNLFINNNCRGTNMTLPTGTQPQIINNTFVNNRTAIYFDRRVSTAGHRYRNNIVFGNSIGIEVNFGTEAENPVFANNLVFGNDTDYQGIEDQTGVDGNLAEDPLLADVDNGDYRLLPSSPAIDAGFSQPPTTNDFFGNPRPVDGDGDMTALVDIGAFEAYLPVANAGADADIAAGSDGVLDASASSDADGEIATYSWAQTGGAAVTITGPDAPITGFTAPAVDATLMFAVTVMDDLGYVQVDDVTIVVVNEPPVITLTGPGSISLEVGDTYTDQGATAEDPEDGSLTDQIVVDNPVDTTTDGTYTVTYTVIDSGGKQAQAERSVIVATPAPPPPPPPSGSGGGGAVAVTELIGFGLALLALAWTRTGARRWRKVLR